MFEIVKEGGILMIPIIACSILAFGIIIERLWSLSTARVNPKALVADIWNRVKNNKLDDKYIQAVHDGSPLGRVLAIGLINRHHSREVMKESIEETGRHVAHQLERYLNTLGTIAAITPLLGLLGTVIGMIQVFNVISSVGVGNPALLSGGISTALLTTAAGITVAIPSLIFHRHFRAKVDALVVQMEQESLKLVEVVLGEREA